MYTPVVDEANDVTADSITISWTAMADADTGRDVIQYY